MAESTQLLTQRRFRKVESNQFLTQRFFSKVDSNQLLTQVMLIQLNSRNSINDNNMDKSVHFVYISCCTAFLQQEVHLVSQWKLRVSHYIGEPCHLLWLMTQLSNFKLNRFNSDSSRLLKTWIRISSWLNLNLQTWIRINLWLKEKPLTQESTHDSTQSRTQFWSLRHQGRQFPLGPCCKPCSPSPGSTTAVPHWSLDLSLKQS